MMRFIDFHLAENQLHIQVTTLTIYTCDLDEFQYHEITAWDQKTKVILNKEPTFYISTVTVFFFFFSEKLMQQTLQGLAEKLMQQTLQGPAETSDDF
jgi:Tfp pilus assembly protein PilO